MKDLRDIRDVNSFFKEKEQESREELQKIREAEFNKIKLITSEKIVTIPYKPAPTTILSKAIEQVEQMGDYKVMFALVDGDKSKPKEERLYTFTDIESKKLREVIYKEIEKDFE